MIPPRRPSARALVLGWMLWTGASSPAHAADDFERYVTAIRRLYDNLDNEEALEQLQRARRIARGVDQDVTLGLYEGLILADLNRWEEARSAFFTVLLLRPDARLPLRGSPKVEKEFEEQRLRAREELARSQPPPAPLVEAAPVAPAEPAMPPSTETVEAPPVEAEPTLPLEVPLVPALAAADRPERLPPPRIEPAQVAPGGLSTLKASPSRPSVIPPLLLGAGVLAGGVGMVSGLRANDQLTSARREPHRTEALNTFRDAHTSALTANIAFGTAALAITGCIVTWLLPRHDPAPAAPTGEVSR